MKTFIENITRRELLQGALSAGALVLGAKMIPQNAEAAPTSWNPSVYLGLEPDGTVVIIAHRSEMGTGIRSVLPMVVADELGADWKHVRVEQALGDPKYGSQNTDGSCSIRDFVDAMHVAGATGRLMLQRAAANKWNVKAEDTRAENGHIIHTASGKKLSFGELVADAAKLPVPAKEDLHFKPESEYKYIGKSLPMIDAVPVTTGTGVFGIDAKMPGMLIAMVERPPVMGGTVQSFDDAEAKKVPGVAQTIQLDTFKGAPMFQQLGGVAILANSTWAAMQGRKKLKIEWNNSANAAFDSDSYKADLRDKAKKPQKVVRNLGDVDAEFGKGGKTVEAEYYVPLLSHAPMEPPAAVAEYKDGKVVTWCATQNPQAVQDAVSGALGIDKTKVECHVTLLGGGFGRKSKPDYVVEAALLSRKTGKPVKVVWTREDDIRFDYYHAVAAMYMKASLGSNGMPTAWLQRSVFPTIGSLFAAGADYGQEFEMGMGWTDLPFALANHRAENGPAKNHVRIGWMRAVANIYHAYAIHSFADELAVAAGKDRVEYLMSLLGPSRKVDFTGQGMKVWNNGQSLDKYPIDTGRLKNVLELAATKSGWANKKAGNRSALGVAVHRSFVSNVAAVVQVDVDDKGKVIIPRVDIAVDCGRTVHPDRVKAQFEGAAVFGTSIAMLGEITAKDGRVMQRNFNDYPVARMPEAPKEVHVHIVPSKEPHAGVGEPGVPPMAPAICNAIYAATGKRVRDLPVKRHNLA
ncbi:MAG: xanthine dehydrogenase family protein molybdopterin-binding subunit [Acidobacteria bacterium]|nr:xanthine dehydrogenase family protein molybdopterin-binding subunit [Acidobacteriota bacterium]